MGTINSEEYFAKLFQENNRGGIFLRDVGGRLPDFTVSYWRRKHYISSYTHQPETIHSLRHNTLTAISEMCSSWKQSAGRCDKEKKGITQNIMNIETYFSYRITADDILVGSSAKMAQGNTLPATKEE